MKTCPQCRTSYTDNNLQFCLQDGTPLVSQTSSNDWSDSETLVTPKPDRMRVQWTNQTANQSNAEHASDVAENFRESAPPKSKTGLIVALSALLTLFAVTAAILGVMYFRRGKTDVVQNTNQNANVKTVNTATNVSNATPNVNANINAAPSQTATPTPKPTLKPKEIETIRTDVGSMIENWKNASENLDLNTHLSNYADTVDYYRAGRVSRAKVREDKERAFAAYNSIRLDISNVQITPDATGDKATAEFDKEWTFEGEEKTSTGKVRQQLQLAKTGGAWLITGEKDLRVYYTGK